MKLGPQIVRFFAVGLINTAFGLGAIFALKWFAQLGDYAANLLGYGIGLSVSYVLNSHWTFRAAVLDGRLALRFLVAFAIAYTLNLTVLALQIKWLGVNAYIAQSMAVAAYAVTFFIACRRFVYSPVDEAGGTQEL